MGNIDFIKKIHTGTERDYVQRVVEYDKAECATVSKQFGKDYWDGDRKYGYGGYHYDGRWRAVAEEMVKHYHLPTGSKILDVGCGKGYLLYEFLQIVPDVTVVGLDISRYAIENAKDEVKAYLEVGNAKNLPYDDSEFDLVISINTLHNLYNFELREALKEIQRVGKDHQYIVVDSYQTERQKMNLLYWQITCECFYTPDEWVWFFEESGYTGDYSYVFYD